MGGGLRPTVSGGGGGLSASNAKASHPLGLVPSDVVQRPYTAGGGGVPPPPPPPPLPMFEADGQNFALAPSVPWGFTLHYSWPAFGGDHRGTVGGKGGPQPTPPPSNTSLVVSHRDAEMVPCTRTDHMEHIRLTPRALGSEREGVGAIQSQCLAIVETEGRARVEGGDWRVAVFQINGGGGGHHGLCPPFPSHRFSVDLPIFSTTTVPPSHLHNVPQVGPSSDMSSGGGGGGLLTERYLWSVRPLTSHICLCACVPAAYRAHVQ